MRKNGLASTRMPKVRSGDLILIIFLFILVFSMLFLQKRIKKQGYAPDNLLVRVSVEGVLYQSLPLSQDQELVIHGHNILVIKDGYAFMKSADCPDQICVRHKAIRSPNDEPIICLPHRVIVEITGKDKESDSSLDGITR